MPRFLTSTDQKRSADVMTHVYSYVTTPQERHLPPQNILRRAVHTLMYNNVMDGMIMGVIVCNTIIMLFVSGPQLGGAAAECQGTECVPGGELGGLRRHHPGPDHGQFRGTDISRPAQPSCVLVSACPLSGWPRSAVLHCHGHHGSLLPHPCPLRARNI